MDDLISRQDAIDALCNSFCGGHHDCEFYPECGNLEDIQAVPSAESVKAYTKADYIMALHKEYGCTLTMAEEAHNKALEHLRSKARMKG